MGDGSRKPGRGGQILAVFSDSHGNLMLLRQAVACAVRQGAGVLVHLGDDFADLAGIDTGAAAVWRVPGLRCPEFGNPFVDRVAVFQFEGWRIQAVHDVGMALPPLEPAGPELVLPGHTHIPDCRRGEDGRWYCNPGHLKAQRDRGADAGFALVQARTDGSLAVRFFAPDGSPAKSAPSGVTVLD